MAKNARQLLEHTLRDAYDMEHKLVDALETMSKKVSDDKFSQALTEHREVTLNQIKRLDKVFDVVERQPRRETCYGINGLIEEFSKFVEDGPSPEVLNVFATEAALKTELYEIGVYKSLINLASKQGLSEAVTLFEATLAEEEQTMREVEGMADVIGDQLALQEG